MRDSQYATKRPVAVRTQGLTQRQMQNASMAMASKTMRLKLSGNIREVSERRQVGDAEEMVNVGDGAWWRNVGMEEGM